jgi:hypothetical protein
MSYPKFDKDEENVPAARKSLMPTGDELFKLLGGLDLAYKS